MSDEIKALHDHLAQEQKQDDPYDVVCEARFQLHGLMHLFCAAGVDLPDGNDIYFLLKPIQQSMDNALAALEKMPSPSSP